METLVFKTGKYKHGFPTGRPYTEEDVQIMNEHIDETFTIFKDIVHEGRPNAQMDKIETAKVWHGNDALSIGLIDEISTLSEYMEKLTKDNPNIEILRVTKGLGLYSRIISGSMIEFIPKIKELMRLFMNNYHSPAIDTKCEYTSLYQVV